jgi:hypothetical protein
MSNPDNDAYSVVNKHTRKGQALSLPVLRVLHMVMCTAKDAEWRELHRSTWIASTKQGLRSAYHTVHVDVRFVIGTPVPTYIAEENATHGDIVQLDIPESIDSGKTPTALLWAAYRMPADDFVFKSDLDTFVSWPAMALLLPGPSKPEDTKHTPPNKSSMGAPFIFFGQEHPKCKHGCAKGGLYMLSRSLLHWVVTKAPLVTTKRAEDKLTCEHIALAKHSGVHVQYRLFPPPMFFHTWVHRVKQQGQYLLCNDTASACTGEYANQFTKPTASSAAAAAVALANAGIPDTGMPPHPTQLPSFVAWIEKGLQIPPRGNSLCLWVQVLCFYQQYITDFAYLMHALRGAPIRGTNGVDNGAANGADNGAANGADNGADSGAANRTKSTWNIRQVSALRMLKKQLLQAPAHTCEVWSNNPPTLFVGVEVRKHTIKARLWQGQRKGRLLLFWSRRLHQADAALSPGMQECVSLFIALHHLRPNVMGQNVKILLADQEPAGGSTHAPQARPWLARTEGFRGSDPGGYDRANNQMLHGCIEGRIREPTEPPVSPAVQKRLKPQAISDAYGHRAAGTCSSGKISMSSGIRAMEPACDVVAG